MILLQKPIFKEWRTWFAWHPVQTIDSEWLWLERVERKLEQAKIPNVYPSTWTIYRKRKIQQLDFFIPTLAPGEEKKLVPTVMIKTDRFKRRKLPSIIKK